MTKLKEKKKLVNSELRLVFLLIGVACSCISTLIYGWFIQFKLPPALVLVSTFFIGIGLTWSTNSASTYCSHIAKNQTGTAISVLNAMRNGGAAISSAIAHGLIRKMNYGWFFTGLSILTFLVSLVLSYIVVRAYKIEKCEVLKEHIINTDEKPKKLKKNGRAAGRERGKIKVGAV